MRAIRPEAGEERVIVLRSARESSVQKPENAFFPQDVGGES